MVRGKNRELKVSIDHTLYSLIVSHKILYSLSKKRSFFKSFMDISLYIPCYNAEKTIGGLIEAVMSQTYPVRDIIVVNDGSTDRSKKIAAAYPVRLLTNYKNKGLAYVRNKALNNIETEFAASLDADCIPKKDWLKKLVHCFERDSLSGIAGAGGRLIEGYSAGMADKWRAVAMEQNWGDKKCVPLYLFGSNTLFKMSALRSVDFYDNRYTTNYEDVDICSRLKKRGYAFVYEPGAVVVHCKHDTVSSALLSYWKWQFPPKYEQGRYKNLEALKEQIFYNISYSLALINRIVLTGRGKELLYPSLLLFFSHSFLDLKRFIEIHLNNITEQDMVLNLRVRYDEMFDLSLEWLKKEFYLEEWVMKRVRADLKHAGPYDPGIAGKVQLPHYRESKNAKRFIEFFYTRAARYLSSLNKIVFEDAWRMVEKLCLR